MGCWLFERSKNKGWNGILSRAATFIVQQSKHNKKKGKITMKLLTALTITAIALTFNVNTANAETCERGSLETGENGHVYCLSWNDMNWWSAYTWCQAQGRHLASMYEICPTWDGGGKNCNLSTFSTNVAMWSATAYGTDIVFSHDKSNVYHNRLRNLTNRALCY